MATSAQVSPCPNLEHMFDSLRDAVTAYRASDADRREAAAAEVAAHQRTRAVVEELRAGGHTELIRALAMESANARAPQVRAPYTAEIDRLIEDGRARDGGAPRP
jgi:hypothetical protein